MRKERLAFLGIRVASAGSIGVASALTHNNGLDSQLTPSIVGSVNQIFLTVFEKVNTQGFFETTLDVENIPGDSSFFILGGLAFQFGVDLVTRGVVYNEKVSMEVGGALALIGITALSYGEHLMNRKEEI